jgi:hypothetical protein
MKRENMRQKFFVSCVSLFIALGVATQRAHAENSRCNNYDPDRRAFFGDLHVHTALSLDAKMQDTRTMPEDAYRYARGDAIDIPPYGDEGNTLHTARIGRPLDFAAVTDHAEMLGENHICHTPGMEGYWSYQCIALRWLPHYAGLMFNYQASNADRLGFCGKDGEVCLEGSRGPWEQIQAAAASANDASDSCRFTSFVAYEWTGAEFTDDTAHANLHRNIIFQGDTVPSLPISLVESKNADRLYRLLDEQCSGECDAVVIPHNSNISLGKMFAETRSDGEPLSTEDAAYKKRYETLIEMIQHKGASECYYGPNPIMEQDELCDFEQLPWNSFAGNTFESLARPIQPDAGFARQALHNGLSKAQSLGTNPFQWGFIGSTDTHRSLAGGVEEIGFQGHGGAGNAAVDADARGLPDEWEFNPGGLAVLYAEENTRESLFAAMKRREAYATSGPRIQVRMFAGEELDEDLCEQSDIASQGYQQGTAMGAELNGPQQTMRIAVSAQKDPGTATQPGTDLQRVQIIKGWLDKNGVSKQKIYDIAGNANNGATVDLKTCETRGKGAAALCKVWQDPQFDAGQRAFYYARVVENPTCRWSTRICNAQNIDCSDLDKLSKDARTCCLPELKKTVQERAWTSPVWYTP